MALYSFGRIKIISRGGVRSAVATAAYHAGIELRNEYDGVTHDFSRKKDVGATYIRMPETAPAAWRDESVSVQERLGLIWNAVEKASPAENARLARCNFLALPHELTVEQGLDCVDRWIERECTSRGMGVTYSLHDKKGNRHVDVMYLVSEYDENGKPIVKAKKEYLCRNRNGEECYLDAEGFRNASDYEKVYRYTRNGEEKRMTPSEAEAEPGWERVSKHPVCRTVKIGGWDDADLAKRWRKAWEEVLNEKFEELGLTVRVDSRSYRERGLSILPTVHEGWGPERKARQAHNAEVRAYNHELDELRKKGVAAVTSIQEQMQELRSVPQTPETLAEHERRYRTHERTLKEIVASGLFQGNLARQFREKLHALSAQIKRLFEWCWARIRGRDVEAPSDQQAGEAARSLLDTLNDAYRRSAATDTGHSSKTKVDVDLD